MAAVVVAVVALALLPRYGVLSFKGAGGPPILDVRFGYSADAGAKVLADLGDEGRQRYEVYQYFDLVFIAIYGSLLALVSYHLAPGGIWRKLLPSVPVITACLDIVEFVTVKVALHSHPSSSTFSLAVAGDVAWLKITFFLLSFTIIVLRLVAQAAGTAAEFTVSTVDTSVRQTYLAVRMGPALLLTVLGVSIIKQWLVSGTLLTSVSAYSTPARATFIACLCAVGVCLVIYRGNNNVENLLLDYTGITAFVVAFVPIFKKEEKVDIPSGAGVPVEEFGELTAEEVSASVGNNLFAFFVALLVVILLSARVSWLRPDPDKPLTRFARIALWIAGILTLGGLLGVLRWSEHLVEHGHAFAAGALFVGIVAVVALNAECFEKERKTGKVKRNWYLVVLVLMVLSLLVWLVAGHRFGVDHWFFWLEASLIILFATFWVIQTLELRGRVSRTSA